MSIINELFEQGFDLYKFLTLNAQNKNATKKLLIREIRDNLKLLEHRNKPGVDRTVLINKLSNSSLLKAISVNYNFKVLAKKQRITEAIFNRLPKARKYHNWDAEQLINSVDEKITAIKTLPDLYPELGNAPINLTLRLDNLYLQLVLISFLVKEAEK
jgi:hypothetical protein